MSRSKLSYIRISQYQFWDEKYFFFSDYGLGPMCLSSNKFLSKLVDSITNQYRSRIVIFDFSDTLIGASKHWFMIMRSRIFCHDRNFSMTANERIARCFQYVISPFRPFDGSCALLLRDIGSREATGSIQVGRRSVVGLTPALWVGVAQPSKRCVVKKASRVPISSNESRHEHESHSSRWAQAPACALDSD